MKDLFLNITKLYNLGEIVGDIEQITGGITNKIYKINTTSGSYIVKILSKDTIDIIEKSENIADTALKYGVPALTSIMLKKHINRVNDKNIILYPFYEGKVLLTKELTLEHVRLLASSLAKLHSIKVKNENINAKRYKKEDFKKLYELSLKTNDNRLNFFKNNYNRIQNIYDEVYDAYMNLSNQVSYVHKDFNRKNVLWKDFEYKIIDWETSTIDNPSIDFFNSAWFLTNDIQEDKFKVFIKEYFNIMTLEDDFKISTKASIIEECNWLAFSLKRALSLITNDEYEINLGLDSIESSLTEILNYYDKINLMIKLLEDNK